ncbi:hypothetical protein [Streptomyces hirsutus]|uniref:hypothetical protein n=1 Tax=Streptomyces hirsutus TaxID=35620 RepID=UPI0036A4606B
MTPAVAAPFRFSSLQVAGTRRLGPSPARSGPSGRPARGPARWAGPVPDAVPAAPGAARAGRAGPASRRAARAADDDRALPLGPAITGNRAIRHRPLQDTDLVLLRTPGTRLPPAERPYA